jgi:hypothetical protein
MIPDRIVEAVDAYYEKAGTEHNTADLDRLPAMQVPQPIYRESGYGN